MIGIRFSKIVAPFGAVAFVLFSIAQATDFSGRVEAERTTGDTQDATLSAITEDVIGSEGGEPRVALPRALRPAMMAAVQNGAGRAYAIIDGNSEAESSVCEADGIFRAVNLDQDFRAAFGENGIAVGPMATDAPASWQWAMELVGFGYERDVKSVAPALPGSRV